MALAGRSHPNRASACEPISTLDECQARCLSKELSGVCAGVSWGASEVCYFYIDP